MDGLAIDIMMNECGLTGIDPDREKATLDAKEFLRWLGQRFGKPLGMGV